MDVTSFRPVDAAVTLSVAWIALGVLGLACLRAPRIIAGVVFPAGALIALGLAATGLWAIGAPPSAAILPAGLPDLPFHVRVDALSGFFLVLLGGVSFGISLFSAGYFRGTDGPTLGLTALQYHVFLAAKASVPLAPRACCFMTT